MAIAEKLGGAFTLPDTDVTVKRMGYGAMQLAGPHVFGPPKDRGEAVAVLREAIESGIDHIDTSDFYGPYVTNQIIKEALHPYPNNLTLVTKVGAKRGDDGSWIMDRSPEWLRQSVHDNLRNLGLDVIPIVNMRVGRVEKPDDTSIAEHIHVLAELQQQGLIQHIGLSTVSQKQFEEARAIANVVCVQNLYNVASRSDDALVDRCAAENIAYAPFFPLGGFTPLQSQVLSDVAARLGASPHQVALAWLLQRSPAIVLIPGTSSLVHLRENIAAADLVLPQDAIAELDTIAG